MSARRDRVVELVRAGQEAFGAALEECDGVARLAPHRWDRPGGGGGEARILEEGRVFERAGVNVSAVHGDQAPPSIAAQHGVDPAAGYFATGLSIVVHPRNPHAPSFHANFRYFEMGDDVWWFGGGADLTPSYGYDEDAAHFHRTLKDYCDGFDPAFYAEAKRSCDDYFYLPHRRETRGVGGIFFDDLHPAGSDGWERAFEAILMSLPPLAGWAFDVRPEPGGPEAQMRERFLTPRDWAA
ncbi:coproporphyrinogen III oxidase [Actinoplanes sp. CA-054009]